jgi:uncharacterized protein YfaS (alpha-2-macroglobulin family)
MLKKIILIAALVMALTCSASAQRNTSGNLNFTLTTNFLFYPGEKPSVNLSATDYYTKFEKNKKYNYDFVFTVYKIKDVDDFFAKQRSRYETGIEGVDSTNLLYLTDEVYTFNKNFKIEENYGYLHFDETIPLSIYENGAYLVKANYKNQVAYVGVIISRLGVVSKVGSNTVLAQVVDRKTGEAVTSANIGFYLKGIKAAGGLTKEGGIFYSEYSNPDNSNETIIVGKSEDDVIISDPYSYYYSGLKKVVYTYTNQPVYRTDSDVKFKSIIRMKKLSGYEPAADKSVKVLIYDSRGNKVYDTQLTTNENGSLDGTFHIEKDAPLGDYSIQVCMTDNEKYPFTFTVEQYKKPEYEVNVTADKMQYYGNDIISGTINSKYYFGSPVADAEVTYEIYRQTYYVPWWRFSDYAWWYEGNEDDAEGYPAANREMVYSGKGKTDADGNFIYTYNINEDFKVRSYYYNWWWGSDYKSDMLYTIYAKVEDKSRREISGSKNVYVTRGGFYMCAKLDKYMYKPNEKASLEINARDYSNMPVATDFEAKILKYTYAFEKYTPEYIKTIKGSTRNDGKGVVTFDVTPDLHEGAYNIEITAKDSRMNVITTSSYFYVYEKDVSWWYSNESQSIQIITDKDSYKKGEICKALIILKQPQANLLVTGQTDNIVFYKYIDVKNGSAEVDIPITDNINSNMEITADYVSEFVFNQNSKNVMVIPDDKFLTVELTPSREIYKPKETGEMKIRVLNNKGLPVSNAEVSLGVIDESIYAIHKENAQDIRKAFYSSQYNYLYTTFNANNRLYGYSHYRTIFEIFNTKKMSESELGVIKLNLTNEENGVPLTNLEIIIDEEFSAGKTDDSGNIEFRLPDGKYKIGILTTDEIKNVGDIKVNKGKTLELKYKIKVDFPISGDEQESIGFRKLDLKETVSPNVTMRMNEEEKSKANKKDKDENLVTPEVRSDFKDAILWMPFVTTDENGYATVDVKYPDNLTQWRMTARVITQDTKVGENIVKVITRKNLLVRMETPKFLQQGDIVTITTIVHNYLESEKSVRVKFKAYGVEFTGEQEKTLTLGKNSDEKLDWTIKVTNSEGKATLYCEALTDEESDAVQLDVPMQPQGLRVTTPVISDLSGDSQSENKSYVVPSFIDKKSAYISFSISPSISSTLLNSLDDLIGYPYGCVEQTMSRFLPSVVVADAYKELSIPLNDKSKEMLPKVVRAGLERLYGFQHPDGGWGWWQNDNSQAYMTAYVLYGLNIARNSGYDVKNSAITNGLKSIGNLYKNINDKVTKAYIMYVLTTFKDKDSKIIAKELLNLESSDNDNYTLALLALSYYNIGQQEDAIRIVNKLESSYKSMTGDMVYWEGGSYGYDWRGDKVQTTSIVLKALVNIKPNSLLTDKTVRWILQQRRGYSWHSTQETANVVYSMIDYLRMSKELEPDFTANIYLNGQMCYTKVFSKNDIYKKDSVITISGDNLLTGENQLRIEKSGKGKLYFSSKLVYFDNSQNIVSSESGFRVEKEYYLLDKYQHYNENKIDYKKKYFNGEAESGDLILVKLKVYSKDNDLNYFMLEDPLPAGCEVVKDDWAINVQDEKDFSGYNYFYWRWWYADKDVRDDKITFFATNLYGNEFEFSYILRAQVPGEYTINPTNAELMYYPEYKGNTSGYKIKINDKK